ncbi:MAG TPA: SUF system NifU family Fe-S cluster assembly protein [Candidatus Nitrosocosmicus sp.]|nr:SUF system NifU family Fe-S cluster assembly protein [Candidatus Nitrosocosmicus sp.]
MSIYQEIILDHYRNPRNFGTLNNPSFSYHLDNPLCGDSITMSILTENEKVKDIKFDGKGCAISMASASILTEKVKGETIENLRKFEKSVILDDLGIELSPNRLKCALLSLEVLQKLINN